MRTWFGVVFIGLFVSLSLSLSLSICQFLSICLLYVFVVCAWLPVWIVCAWLFGCLSLVFVLFCFVSLSSIGFSLYLLVFEKVCALLGLFFVVLALASLLGFWPSYMLWVLFVLFCRNCCFVIRVWSLLVLRFSCLCVCVWFVSCNLLRIACYDF